MSRKRIPITTQDRRNLEEVGAKGMAGGQWTGYDVGQSPGRSASVAKDWKWIHQTLAPQSLVNVSSKSRHFYRK